LPWRATQRPCACAWNACCRPARIGPYRSPCRPWPAQRTYRAPPAPSSVRVAVGPDHAQRGIGANGHGGSLSAGDRAREPGAAGRAGHPHSVREPGQRTARRNVITLLADAMRRGYWATRRAHFGFWARGEISLGICGGRQDPLKLRVCGPVQHQNLLCSVPPRRLQQAIYLAALRHWSYRPLT
jgi:hypothetical protein